MLKNLQYGFGFLIGFLGALILCIGAIMGVESLIGRPMPLKVPLTILISIGAGVVVSRWIGRLDLSPVLDTGRAVLVGRGPAGAAWRLRAAGATSAIPPPTSQTAIWRFVLPLEPRQP